jgi:hypothetical protein
MFKKGYKKLVNEESDSEGTEEWKKEIERKFSEEKEEEEKKKTENKAKQLEERMNIERRKFLIKK